MTSLPQPQPKPKPQAQAHLHTATGSPAVLLTYHPLQHIFMPALTRYFALTALRWDTAAGTPIHTNLSRRIRRQQIRLTHVATTPHPHNHPHPAAS